MDQRDLQRIAKERPIYKLTDDSVEILKGSFHEEELQKVIEDNVFHIENTMHKKERGRDTFLLVKWKRYPEKFNSWVNEKGIKDP